MHNAEHMKELLVKPGMKNWKAGAVCLWPTSYRLHLSPFIV